MVSLIAAEIGHAVATLRRRPSDLVVPVLVIALGIGAATAIFSALHAALFNPLPFPNPNRLVMGRATFNGEINPWVAGPDYYDYRDQASAFTSLSAYRPSAVRVTIRREDAAESVPVTGISWDLFGTLGVGPALGRHFTASEGERGAPPVAIISDGYWKRSFGGARTVIGATLPIRFGSGEQVVTVVGVMPEGFRFAYPADVWFPIQRNTDATNVRRFHNFMLVGRLKDGVSLRDAQAQVDAISAQLERTYPESNRNKALLLTPLQDALAESDRPTLLILLAAVGVLLLVTCADVAALLLSRGAARQTELAIRSALGATRVHLAAQLLAETLIVAAIAGGIGLLLAMWLRTIVLRLLPLESLGVTALPLGGPVLLFAFIVTLATSLLVGVVPAWLGTRSDVVADLRSRASETPGRALFRQALVAVQVALAVVLLVVATLLGRSLLRLQAVDPGFETDRLLTAQIALAGADYSDPAARVRFFSAFLDDVRTLPGVSSANLVNMVPILDKAGNVPVWDADSPPADTSEAPLACIRSALPGYFRTMGIPFVAGRDLSASDAGALMPGHGMSVTDTSSRMPPMVLSESTARTVFPGVNPLGRRLAIFTGGPSAAVAEVVGLVGDVRMNSLADSYSLAMYAPYQVLAQPTMRLVVRTTGDPASAVAAIRGALARRDRGLVLAEIATMDTIIARSLEGFSLRAGGVVLFGGAALLLAMLGVYGVLSLTVNRRRRDIGVRIAMGAPRERVLLWIVGHGLAPVGVGLVVGLTGAAAVGRSLRSQLFDVPPGDPLAFAAGVACLGAAAVAACLVPAWRAMHVDPIVALRAE